MFEFRGAREAEREFAERGSANQTRGQQAYEAAMAQNEQGQAENIARAAAAQAAAQQIMQEQSGPILSGVDRAALVQEAQARAAGSEQFRQAGFDAYQAQLMDAANIARAQAEASRPLSPMPAGILAGALGGFMNTRIANQLEDAATRERFFGDPRLTQPVYGTTGRVTGVYDPYMRLTGRDPIADAQEDEMRRMQEAGQPEITAPIADPVTGQQRCPDGYIFDEDLNACRLAPMERTVAATTPGEAYARTGLLDVAPEGLMGFQQRYGAGFGTPMDFEAANLAFRRQGATYPEYFQTPPKLDGYTLLS